MPPQQLVGFSIFDYCYRDASNYKTWRSLLLRGQAASANAEDLQGRFDSAEFFIAEQPGIPPLYSELWALSGCQSVDDRVWHTFYDLRLANTDEINAPIFDSVENLIAKIMCVEIWNETLSPHWGS